MTQGSAGDGVRATSLERSVIALARAGATQHTAVAADFPSEVNPFAAFIAHDPLTFVSREFFGRKLDLHPLYVKEIFGRHLAVGEHLLLVLVIDFRVAFASLLLGRFPGGDAHGTTSLDIHECRGHLSPVAELHGPFAQATARNDADRIGGAAIDLDEGEKALTIAAARIGDAEVFESKHGHAHAEHLPGTKVAVGGFSFL